MNKDYTISENAEDYTPSAVATETITPASVTITDGNTATDNGIDEDTEIAFTNNREGLIPTGVILSVAGLLVVGIIAVIGFIFFGIRSKRRYDED